MNKYSGYIITLLGAILIIVGIASLISLEFKKSSSNTSKSGASSQSNNSYKVSEVEAKFDALYSQVKTECDSNKKNLTREIETINNKLLKITTGLSKLHIAPSQANESDRNETIASQKRMLEKLTRQLNYISTDIARLQKQIGDSEIKLTSFTNRLEASEKESAKKNQMQQSALDGLSKQLNTIEKRNQTIFKKLEQHLNNHIDSRSSHSTIYSNCEDIQSQFDLRFDTNSADLSLNAQSKLDTIVAYFSRCKNLLLKIEGHTDSIGSESDNLLLSWRRIETVSDYLFQKGLSTNQLLRESFGEFEPMASNAQPGGRALNRRVTIHVIKSGGNQ